MACKVARCWRTAALVAPTHERWLAAATPSPRISLTVPKVPSCVEPPAPKVTEQNSGWCAYSARRVRRSLSAPSGVLGGKNSKLTGTVIASLNRSTGFLRIFCHAAYRAPDRAGPHARLQGLRAVHGTHAARASRCGEAAWALFAAARQPA